MTRLHDMFYGPLLNRIDRSAQRDSAAQEVVIHKAAADALTAQLRCTGQSRSGVLFGTLSEGTLAIDYAAQGTTPGRRMGDGLPLALDDDYVLGWADALTAAHAGELDWQGVWLTMPNAELPNAMEQLRWARQARDWGLLTEELILLFVGWEEGRLSATAYVQQDEPVSIPASFSRDRRLLPPQGSQ